MPTAPSAPSRKSSGRSGAAAEAHARWEQAHAALQAALHEPEPEAGL